MRDPIQLPIADLTPEAMVESARGLRDLLRERQAEAESARRMLGTGSHRTVVDEQFVGSSPFVPGAPMNRWFRDVSSC